MVGPEDIYQRLILDHSRAPRNFGPLAGAGARATRDNPLCGDAYTIAVTVGGDGRIAAAAFEGAGCAISMASASMMTDAVRGRTPAEARELFQRFDQLVSGQAQQEMGDLGAFAAVASLPVRAKCARLPWQALLDALAGV